MAGEALVSGKSEAYSRCVAVSRLQLGVKRRFGGSSSAISSSAASSTSGFAGFGAACFGVFGPEGFDGAALTSSGFSAAASGSGSGAGAGAGAGSGRRAAGSSYGFSPGRISS